MSIQNKKYSTLNNLDYDNNLLFNYKDNSLKDNYYSLLNSNNEINDNNNNKDLTEIINIDSNQNNKID